jgi:hypothetical protein
MTFANFPGRGCDTKVTYADILFMSYHDSTFCLSEAVLSRIFIQSARATHDSHSHESRITVTAHEWQTLRYIHPGSVAFENTNFEVARGSRLNEAIPQDASKEFDSNSKQCRLEKMKDLRNRSRGTVMYMYRPTRS